MSRKAKAATTNQNSFEKTSVNVVQESDSAGLDINRWKFAENIGTEKSITCNSVGNIKVLSGLEP